MKLELNNSVIRSYRKGDEVSIVCHANNRNIWRNLTDRFPHPYTLEDARHWIEAATAQLPETHFAITINDEVIGGIGLELKDGNFRRTAEIGYWLGEDFWGRGIVTDAVRALTAWAFENLDVVRIYAGVYDYNAASMRVLEKAGYTFEARLRKHVTKDGQTFDDLIYATVRE